MPRQPPPPYFVLRGHKGLVSALHFTIELYHQGFQQPALISGSDVGEIFIWDLKSNRTSHRLNGHENKTIMSLHCYKYSLISQGRDGVINIWNNIQDQWTVIRRIHSTSTSVGFCASSLISVENSVHLMLPNEDKNSLKIHDISGSQVRSIKFRTEFGMCMCIKAFNMNDKTLLLAGFENGCIGMWDYETEKELCHIKCHKELVTCLDFDSNYSNMGISGSVDTSLQVWSLSEKLELIEVKTIEVVNKGINAVKIRDDRKIVITAGLDCKVRVFSWKTLQPLAVLQFHELSVHSLACCPVSVGDHRSVFASGSKDQNIALWEIY
ncbi:hypothetical protein JTE90_013270 [Oedothorax gibbosus]|uniref:Guanine nucleotide-binding protein subunit beta-like protein 1 n=1 Tax=Oedothorax gibbosus TaxID=931172 RepID=A0AAV6VEU0_9ARAC|nr:hypothetical protein JTE90_013270 [Oedothorax gibbosus]